MWIFIILLVVAVIFIILGSKGEQQHQHSMNHRINSYYHEHNFKPTKSYFNEEKSSGIAYDEEHNKLLLFEHMEFDNYDDTISLIEPSTILDAKIIENGDTITRTARGSQLVGVGVGSLLAGIPGMVVGGLSGKKYTDKEIKRLELELGVNDINNPIRRVTFYKNKNGIKQNSRLYKEYYEQAYYWYKLIEVLIHQQKDNSNDK